MDYSHLSLSILIPTYNNSCVTLVKDLLDQCREMNGLKFEIVVADDGSTDQTSIKSNHQIDHLNHCHVIWGKENRGRSATRNMLAHEARYDWLLFIDSHMSVIKASFIECYLNHTNCAQILYGGYKVTGDDDTYRGNLRWKYEVSCQDALTAENRSKSPYANFHTSNFCIRREVMCSYPLDERFKRYGYEDVLYGKTLKAADISISHIDNPVGFNRFENNRTFLSKTEEALCTLHDFSTDIGDYSRMLVVISHMKKKHLLWIPRRLFAVFRPLLRRNLLSKRPNLRAFDLYRMGYYLHLSNKKSMTGTNNL